MPDATTPSLRLPRNGVLIAAVALIAIVVFLPAVGGPWIYDDRPLISENGWVHSFVHWKRWFLTDFWDVNEETVRFGTRMIYWRPLVSASYAFDWRLGGGDPFVFHVTNLLWHAAASALAFVVLKRWVGSTLPALLAALVFAVHPSKAESVAWIAGRTDVMCVVFLLLASEAAARRMRGERWAIALEILATLLAYGVKEQAFVLPMFLAVEAWVAAGRPPVDRKVVVPTLKAAAPQVVVAILYLAARARFMPIRPPIRNLDYVGTALQVFETFGRFTAIWFAPRDLSVQQALIHTSGGKIVFHYGYVALGAAVLIAIAVLAFASRKRRPMVTVGILFFLVTIFPTSNVVPMGMQTMLAERFLYLPSLGLVLAAAAYLDELGDALSEAPSAARARMVSVAVAACAAVLAAVSLARSADYLDDKRFWAREYRLHPDSLDAHRFLIAQAVEARKYDLALTLTASAQHSAATNFPHTGQEADFIQQGLELLLLSVPDRDVASLRAIDAFYQSILEKKSGDARLETRGVRIVIPIGGVIAARLGILRPKLLTSRADIASRLGEDQRAIELAEAARKDCPACADISGVAAFVAARASDYRHALEVLDQIAARYGEARAESRRKAIEKAALLAKQHALQDEGPVKLHLRATELATLEAWGRAYEVLAPHKEQIKMAPGFAIGFAELAWRAGERTVALEVLRAVIPEAKIGPTTQEWSRKMGWSS